MRQGEKDGKRNKVQECLVCYAKQLIACMMFTCEYVCVCVCVCVCVQLFSAINVPLICGWSFFP